MNSFQHGLLASRNDGLGSRLVAIMNGLRLSRDYNASFKIFWPKQNEVGVSLGEADNLFSKDFIDRYFIGPEAFLNLKHSLIDVNITTSYENRYVLGQKLDSGYVYSMDAIRETSFRLPWENEEFVKSTLSIVLCDQDFCPIVSEWMALLRKKLSSYSHSPIAYHLRHGDVTKFLRTRNRPWPNKFVPIEIYIAHIDHIRKSDDKNYVVIFGDNEESLHKLHQQRKDCILFRDLIDLTQLRPIQIDFLELYAMSLCSHIFAPSNSGFSRVAAAIGGCKISDIVLDLPKNILAIAMEKLCQRLEAGPSLFLNHGEIGQCMIHADNYLLQTHQQVRAGKMASRLIKDGVNISFLYSMAMTRLVFNGEDLEAQQIADIARTKYLEELADFSKVLALKSLAFIKLNEMQIATRAACTSFWAVQYSRPLEVAIAKLFLNDALNSSNFIPFDITLQNIFCENGKPPPVEALEKSVQDTRFDQTILAMACDWSNYIHKRSARQLTSSFLSRLLAKVDLYKNNLQSEIQQYSLISYESRLLTLLGQHETALELSRTAVLNCPENPLYHYRLAVTYKQIGKFEAALESITISRSLAPKTALYMVFQAQLFATLRKFTAAEETYLAACDADPGLPSIGIEAAAFFKKIKNWKLAEACVDVSLQSIPMDPTALSLKGEFLGARGRYDEALSIFRDLELKGEGMRNYGSQIGNILCKMGRPDEGLTYLKNAFIREPGNLLLRLALARLQRELGDLNAALHTLDFKTEKQNDLALLAVERSLVLKDLGRSEDAIFNAMTAANLRSDQTWYSNHLIRIKKELEGNKN